MSERKVLSKHYPADFDPRELTRKRGPKSTGPKVQVVRLMAPFSMKCTTCGEFIYRGRKFNSRKETPLEERYLGIQIFFFSIKCTRCSAEIIFRTDPKNNDYAMVKGAVRNMEPWRNRTVADETVEQRLDRLEREEGEAAENEERDAMADLEAKNADARREMAVADELDEIRHRNARIARADKEGVDYAELVVRREDEERERQDREDEEAARQAFAAARLRAAEETEDLEKRIVVEDMGLIGEEDEEGSEAPSTAATAAVKPVEPEPKKDDWKPKKKVKKDYSAMLGIKKKTAKVPLV